MSEGQSNFFGVESPFIRFCGFEPLARDEVETSAILRPRPELMNARGVVHGGVLVSFFDVTMGAAAMFAAQTTEPVVTIDLHTSFLSAATGILECRARVLRRGRRLIFCEGEIFAGDELCAKAMATFTVSRPQASDTSSAQE